MATPLTDSPEMRLPPSDKAAEMCVLGSMLLHPACIPDVQAITCGADFYLPQNGQILETLNLMCAQDRPIDMVTVRDAAQAYGVLDQVGGVEYLLELVDGVPDTANVEYYATIVRDMAIQRRMIKLADEVIHAAYDPTVSAADLLEKAEAGLYDVAAGRTDLQLTTAIAAAERVMERAQTASDTKTPSCVLTHLDAIDTCSGGMRPGELIVLAGDTGCGKTTLADCIAVNVAEAGGKVLIVSVEMLADERAERFLQSIGQVQGHKLRSPERLEPEDWTNLYGAAGKLEGMNILIHGGKATSAQAVSQARRAGAKMGGLDLVVVDYLQLLTADQSQGKTRAERVSSMAWALKMDLAMGLEVPVILLSQLTRSSMKADDPPTMHDLKESGDIENHANAIWLLHRPPAGQPQMWDEVWFCQDKHRSMPKTPWEGDSAVRLKWDGMTTTFSEAYYANTR